MNILVNNAGIMVIKQVTAPIDAISGICLPRSYKNGQETLTLKLEGTTRYAGKLQELWPLAKATFVGPAGEKTLFHNRHLILG